MRYSLRTLLVAVALLPPLIGALWPLGVFVYRSYQPRQATRRLGPTAPMRGTGINPDDLVPELRRVSKDSRRKAD